jgi:DNA polymerase-4
MEPTILHLAIDSFAIQAERLRCPKLVGRPFALAPADSPRPRVLAVSREARAAGVRPGTPLVVARRACRDLIALPPDRDLYAGLSDSIRERLAPFAPFAEGARSAGSSAGFALDLTGVARSHAEARVRASAAGAEVERAFRLHPTLGMAATRLVSRVAATVLAPDGELLDVPPGGETAFLAPLGVRVLPVARERAVAARLDLLNAHAVGDVQAIAIEPLRAAFGTAAAAALWREARGLDAAPRHTALAACVAAAEETLAQETNDLRVLGARLSRLVVELTAGLRARRAEASSLVVQVGYADGREGRASAPLDRESTAMRACGAIATLERAALTLLDRAASRRVRVRRLRIEARERPRVSRQLHLWADDATTPTRRDALDEALLGLRARFGTSTVVPAAWMAHGLVRPSPRP